MIKQLYASGSEYYLILSSTFYNIYFAFGEYWLNTLKMRSNVIKVFQVFSSQNLYTVRASVLFAGKNVP